MKDRERRDVQYVLGALILHDTRQRESLEAVDAQQRLLTLRLILLLAETVDDPKPGGQADNSINRVWIALRRHDALSREHRAELAEFRDKPTLAPSAGVIEKFTSSESRYFSLVFIGILRTAHTLFPNPCSHHSSMALSMTVAVISRCRSLISTTC